MGRLNFGQLIAYPAPPVNHDLHNDNADLVDGDVVEVVYDGLSAKPTVEPKLVFHYGVGGEYI